MKPHPAETSETPPHGDGQIESGQGASEEANSLAITDADWESLQKSLGNPPPEVREELEGIIARSKMLRRGAPPIPSNLKASLTKVAEDAQRLATSIGELPGRAKLIINLVRQGETIENRNLGLVEALGGTLELPPFESEFISSEASGFLWEIQENVKLLGEVCARAAAAEIPLESKAIAAFLFVKDIDGLLRKHWGKGVTRSIKRGHNHFVYEACKIAGIHAGIDDAIKTVTKTLVKNPRERDHAETCCSPTEGAPC
jgi:hypothetical protein